MLFDAHTRSFAALGGVARQGIYDNIKTAVDLCANQRKVGFWSGKEKGPEHREKDELGFECFEITRGPRQLALQPTAYPLL